jgi:hypothetical protein
MADSSVTHNAEEEGPTVAGPAKPDGSIVPFSMKFLGLRLRLAFTKRRFDEVEAIYRSHVDDTGTSGSGTPTTTSSSMGRSSSRDEQARLTTAQQLVGVFDESFGSLREEILAIEQGQEIIQKKILPKLLAQIELHDSFMVFLQGFYMENRKNLKSYKEEEEDGGDYIQECEEEHAIHCCEDDGFSGTLVEDNMDMEGKQDSGCGYCDIYEEEAEGCHGLQYNQEWELDNEGDVILYDHDEDDVYSVNLDVNNMAMEEEDNLYYSTESSTLVLPAIIPKCHLPMLNMGEETSTAVKQLIAVFAGVPTQGALHDLRSLASMLGRGRFPSNRASYASMGSTSTITPGVASALSTNIAVPETVSPTLNGDESALAGQPSLSGDP